MYADAGLLILRLALGLVFFPHGRQKLKEPDMFIGFLKRLGTSAPVFFAWLVALLETVGATLIILGMATLVLALGLAVDLLHGWECEFLLMAGALALVFTGAGWRSTLISGSKVNFR